MELWMGTKDLHPRAAQYTMAFAPSSPMAAVRRSARSWTTAPASGDGATGSGGRRRTRARRLEVAAAGAESSTAASGG